jgi:hypothetical protein
MKQEDGAWMCGVGHMFHYEAPPAEPPWCGHPECQALGFVWIIKDDVTSRDWIPEGQSWT